MVVVQKTSELSEHKEQRERVQASSKIQVESMLKEVKGFVSFFFLDKYGRRAPAQ